MNNRDRRQEAQKVSMPEDCDNTVGSTDDIPRTADEVMDISSYYSDNAVLRGDGETDGTQQARLLSPTPPLVIDKRMTKLATLPPRISFHQESSLEDWSKSLFSVIGGKGKRSSVLMRSNGGDAAGIKERRTTIRPMSPFSMTGESRSASATALNSLSPKAAAPSLPDVSFGANLTLGPIARGPISAIGEGAEQVQVVQDEAKETEDDHDGDAGEQAVDVDTTTTVGEEVKEEADGSPVVPLLPDVSLGKDLDPPALASPPSSKSPRRASIDSLPPSPPPKPKPKPTPLVPPLTITSATPRTNVITGISGKSPVNPLFGAKPQPLPIPIPLSQIRAQLRPAPPKPFHPPPKLPLPPLRRAPSQPNLQPPSPRPQLPPVPSPERVLKHDSAASHTSAPHSRPNSSQTLHPMRANPGGRDSDLSTVTVTPATIATAKSEVVRTAVASVVDSDAVSLASRRESVVSTAAIESQTLTYGKSDIGGESPRTQETPDDSMVSETSSVSLLRDGPQSKWPAPPPPPVETETDSTPRRVSRFRTTSLGRVTQLQAMGGTASSPISSHSSHGSSDTTSSSTSEIVSLTTPKGVNGMPLSSAPKANGRLAAEARMLSSATDTFGGVDVESESGEETEARSHPPEITLSESYASIPLSTHPLLAQLHPYTTSRNPASCFTDLVEIAEGESGSVFAARVASTFADARSHEGQQGSAERPIPPGTSHVAIKRIPLPPVASSPSLSDDSPVSNKLISVLHELSLLKNLDHEHLLLLDAVYVGSSSARDADAGSASAVDTSLWIRMELMERSLADVIGLVAEGLALQERLVGRFASDVGASHLLVNACELMNHRLRVE